MPTGTLEGFPLTAQQERARNFLGKSSLPCASAGIRLKGPLDEQKLARCIDTLVQRHEILRTTYVKSPHAGGLLQVIAEFINPWKQSGLDGEGPLHFSCSLEPASPGETVLRLSIPFLSVDRESFAEITRQLAAVYDSNPEAADPFQYADYAEWQRTVREDEQSRPSVRFWSQMASKPRPEFKLPLEKPAPEASFSPRSIPFNISDEERAGLERAARVSGAGLQDVLFALWAEVLLRMTASPSILISSLWKNRNHAELENALGLFEQFLPVECNTDEQWTLGTAAAQVRLKRQTAEKHADAFQWRTNAEEKRQPVLFGWRRADPVVMGGGVSFQLEEVQCVSEPFSVFLDLTCLGKSIAGTLAFDSCRVSFVEANWIVERFLTLLREALRNPQEPLSSSGMIGAEEEKILRKLAWSPPPGNVRPVLDAFRDNVTRSPHKRAVVCGDESLTYADLDTRSNELARYLNQVGIRAGKAVGLSSERSVELVVGIMGILKAGGAYVPLDPSYPPERLEFILADAEIDTIVTQERLADRFRVGRRLVLLDTGTEMGPTDSGEPAVGPSNGDLAYIIYTSGSTGRPKGVMISHQNLAFSTAARLEYYREPLQNFLLLSSFAFDSSIAGIFWTLSAGGILTIPREGHHQDPSEVLQLISSGQVSHSLALPSFYRAILRDSSAETLAAVKAVIVAGEVCNSQLVREHYQVAPETTLYNEYGPTEGTVWSTVHQCRPDDQDPVPIGRPVPGMGVFILNSKGNWAGLGVMGEICISGPAIASGYRNRPELTETRFARSPFDTNKRFYRTGDVGRILANGSIEFHGRNDDQVKIRGYRVEIGEIEQCILGTGMASEVVVLAREDSPGDQRLVAYVVPRTPGNMALAELKAEVRKRLPVFMTPSAFVVLERLPLTPNGKVDRHALPPPASSVGNDKYAPPEGPREEMLAEIWKDLLRLERISRNENFFELGGHSLLALQFVARVRELTQIEVPLRAIFDFPTVEGLARVLGQPPKQPRSSGQIRKVHRQAVSQELLDQWENAPEEESQNLHAVQEDDKRI